MALGAFGPTRARAGSAGTTSCNAKSTIVIATSTVTNPAMRLRKKSHTVAGLGLLPPERAVIDRPRQSRPGIEVNQPGAIHDYVLDISKRDEGTIVKKNIGNGEILPIALRDGYQLPSFGAQRVYLLIRI